MTPNELELKRAIILRDAAQRRFERASGTTPQEVDDIQVAYELAELAVIWAKMALRPGERLDLNEANAPKGTPVMVCEVVAPQGSVASRQFFAADGTCSIAIDSKGFLGENGSYLRPPFRIEIRQAAKQGR